MRAVALTTAVTGSITMAQLAANGQGTAGSRTLLVANPSANTFALALAWCHAASDHPAITDGTGNDARVEPNLSAVSLVSGVSDEPTAMPTLPAWHPARELGRVHDIWAY